MFRVVPIPSRARYAHIHLQLPTLPILEDPNAFLPPSYPIIVWIRSDVFPPFGPFPPDGYEIYGMNQYDLREAGGRCIVPTNATHLLIVGQSRRGPSDGPVSLQAHITWELEL